MFDFPSSPAIGAVSNGYTFDGVGWAGGPGVSGPVTEQWIDVTGLGAITIQVPTWAKGAQLSGNFYFGAATANNIVLTVSMDGTTFLGGASDYTYMGPVHNEISPFYSTQAAVGGAYIPLTFPATGHANISVPCSFTVDMNVVKDSAHLFVVRAYSKEYVDAGGRAAQTTEMYGYIGSAAAGNAIKAIRLTNSALAPTANSWLKVRWLGDSAAIPQSNAIADAPSDGGEYTRVNGVWRLKHQRFDLSGLAWQDVSTPVGAKLLALKAVLYPPAAAPRNFVAYVSLDGTAWCTGANDYYYAGFNHNTVTTPTAVTNYPGVATTVLLLSLGHTDTSQAATVEALLEVTRGSTGAHWHNQTHAITGVGAQGYTHAFLRSFVLAGAVGAGSNTNIKKYRFQHDVGVAMAAGSYISLDWSY